MIQGYRHTHVHRHGTAEHEHDHWHGPGDHADPRAHDHEHEHLPLGDEHDHDHDHGHSHGLVDRSIVRSRDGMKTVAISLAVLGVATLLQLAIYVASGSVALLADLVHNFGDALTAIP